MPRRPRADAPGQWHHVTNRGIAKRTLFENGQDRRMFVSLLAKEVRAGRLEVHAFVLMGTHDHLLVRSPSGQLSQAMANIQREYSRWFNRSRWRDGPLVRTRFRSAPVHDIRYRCNVVNYIHDNPVHARMTKRADRYPGSSAWYWKRRSTRGMPRWLATAWIAEELDRRGATELAQVFPGRLDKGSRTMIERRVCRRLPEEGEDTTLEHVMSPRTVRWAFRKARLADGTAPFRPVSPPRLVEQAVLRWMRKIGPLLGLLPNRARDAWRNLRSGLLRALAGCTQREIVVRLHRHDSTICRDLQAHRALLRRDPSYERLHAAIADDVLGDLRRTARVPVS